MPSIVFKSRSTRTLAFAAGLGLAVGVASTALLPSGASATAQPGVQQRFATVNMLPLLERAVVTVENVRQTQETSLREQSAISELELRLRSEAEELQREAQIADEARRQEIQQRLQQMNTEYQARNQQALQLINEVSLGQTENALARITSAVNAIAQRQGYTHVFSTRQGDFDVQSAQAIFNEISLRPVVVFPEGDDITRLVAAEIGVDLDVPVPNPEDLLPQPEETEGDALQLDAPGGMQPIPPAR